MLSPSPPDPLSPSTGRGGEGEDLLVCSEGAGLCPLGLTILGIDF